MAEVIDPDDRLTEAMRGGDETALCMAIDRYTTYVGAIVWNIVGGRLGEADAGEIVSETFYSLWKNSEKVRPGKLKAYLGSIARSKALDALRRARQELSLEDETLELRLPGPEDELTRKEEYRALRRAIESMSEPDRSIFIRHYYYCQSTGEIARALGCKVKTVQTKLCRGREALRRALTEGGFFVE